MATRVWRGDQAAFQQTVTIAVSGTWGTGDTATLTINDKDLTVTVGSETTTTDIAAIIVLMVNGDAVSNDETRNTTGDQLGEWNGITASSSTSTITLTADTAGEPFTVTASETTTGDGALGTPTTTVFAAGPNELAAGNVTGGSLTPTGNVLVFENHEEDCLYGLDQSAAGTWDELRILSTYTGSIGLAPIHLASPTDYHEYLDRYLKINASEVVIGQGEGSGSGQLQLDLGSVATDVMVHHTASSSGNGLHALRIVASNASNTLEVAGGTVDIAAESADSSQFSNVAASGNANVRISRRTTVGTVTCSGSARIDIDQDASLTAITSITVHGGIVTITGDNTITTLNVYGGTVRYAASGTVTNVNIGPNGTLDLTGSTQAVTLTSVAMDANATLKDPSNLVTFANAIDLGLAGLDDVTLELGKGIDVLPS